MRATEAALLSVTDVIQVLGANCAEGLSSGEVERRRRIHGSNELEMCKEEPLWQKYIAQFRNPLILLLLASAFISLCTKQYDDAISITVAIVIVVTVAFVQEYRSERSLEALSKLIPPKCHCIRDGVLQEMLACHLVPGDTVCVSLGDRIPADIRLVEVIDLEVDESSFTGESTPSHKHTQPQSSGASSSTHFGNVAYMGTFVCGGHGKGVVINTGERSEFGAVFKMMQSEEPPKTPLQKSMDMLGKQLSFYSLCIIGGIMLLGWLQGKKVLDMFTIGVSLAVAAIPEGLPIVVTVTLALGVMRMARKHAIIKKLPIVETLGCVNVVCSDKTGTLTENRMEVTDIYTASHHHASLLATPHSGIRDLTDAELFIPNSHPDVIKVVEVGCVCNNAQIRDGKILGHPTEGAMMAAAQKLGLYSLRDQFVRTEERSFNSQQKWMAVRVRHRALQATDPPVQSEVWYMKGAIDVVLKYCTTESSGHRMTKELVQQYEGKAMEYGRRGMRVVAMACGSELSQLSFVGMMAMLDPPRPNVPHAVAKLKEGGVMVKMITGDSKETSESIARSLGLWEEGSVSLSGYELDSTDPLQLTDRILHTTVFYRVSPRHKVVIVKLSSSFVNEQHTLKF
ncbi:hypothetical protein EMCRGX_G031555 [Ephydatia muelleri]